MDKKVLLGSKTIENFQLRGLETSRLESLSDGVFALAIALLLISSSVPTSFIALKAFMFDFIPFSICMIFVIWIWSEQYTFFLRYGLANTRSTLLNSLLLFFVLFYVYPLKFLITFLVNILYFGILAPDREILNTILIQTISSDSDIPYLMIIYGIGFTCIFGILYLLHKHALSKQVQLQLNELEILETKYTMRQYIGIISVASLSIILAILGIFFTPAPWFSFLSGLCYSLIGLVVWRNQVARHRQLNTYYNTEEV